MCFLREEQDTNTAEVSRTGSSINGNRCRKHQHYSGEATRSTSGCSSRSLAQQHHSATAPVSY